ncbi:N-acetyltransferase [Microbulbifer salipaludis]|uniref:N-acetyltransferase n=1 Tax=Microbulbifer salipaludis TaxID=187980 RepID=A0ABS3E725_9GAMM|nr:N-acetyltransferase [Microbulbifer salipaludis]MBN8431008.1 N-acetyltransferase [Microbulbifer salipaludis]
MALIIILTWRLSGVVARYRWFSPPQVSSLPQTTGSELMHCKLFDESEAEQVIALFRSVFSVSEGAAEGETIATLVSHLIEQTAPDDLLGCVAKCGNRITGSIFFSRFTVPNGATAFILSPVAIATDVQGTGVGQRLIRYGLDELRSRDARLVFTYGDPAFYSKTGFQQIGEDMVAAPYPLSQPIGWLAQSLDGEPVPAMQGATHCVAALSDPGYW